MQDRAQIKSQPRCWDLRMCQGFREEPLFSTWGSFSFLILSVKASLRFTCIISMRHVIISELCKFSKAAVCCSDPAECSLVFPIDWENHARYKASLCRAVKTANSYWVGAVRQVASVQSWHGNYTGDNVLTSMCRSTRLVDSFACYGPWPHLIQKANINSYTVQSLVFTTFYGPCKKKASPFELWASGPSSTAAVDAYYENLATRADTPLQLPTACICFNVL